MNGRIVFEPYDYVPESLTDITDAVGVLYDLCLSSMDFRSGFWSYEDAAPVAEMAELMGYEQRDQIVKYRDDQMHSVQASAFIRDWAQDNPVQWTNTARTEVYSRPMTSYDMHSLPHDHIFSTPGRCMWPGCTTTETDSE